MQESSVLSLIFEAQDPSFPVTSWIKRILTQLWTITVRQWIEAWSVRTESTASLCKTCIFKSLDTYWGVAVKCCYLFGHNRAYHGTVTALCFVSTPKAYMLLICKATVNKTQKIQIKKSSTKHATSSCTGMLKLSCSKYSREGGKRHSSPYAEPQIRIYKPTAQLCSGHGNGCVSCMVQTGTILTAGLLSSYRPIMTITSITRFISLKWMPEAGLTLRPVCPTADQDVRQIWCL